MGLCLGSVLYLLLSIDSCLLGAFGKVRNKLVSFGEDLFLLGLANVIFTVKDHAMQFCVAASMVSSNSSQIWDLSFFCS